jgi:uncharacterized membrane protein YeiH
VFWVGKPAYLVVCVVVAVIVYFTAHLVESRYRLLLWLDAAGLSAYAVMGAAKGLSLTGSPIVALVTGMMTATLGGILRDLLSGEPSVLMRPEIYVSAALVGAGVLRRRQPAGCAADPGVGHRCHRRLCRAWRRHPLRLGVLALPFACRPPARRRHVRQAGLR